MDSSIVLWVVLGAIVAVVIFGFVGKAKKGDKTPNIPCNDPPPDPR